MKVLTVEKGEVVVDQLEKRYRRIWNVDDIHGRYSI
jgi:hypothetical protein